ncbi:MAG: hypothetical protein M0T74_16735 [Desulfitobacterium hafniense]|nr:hypothetical protein [Desulfitobacterium hafniense]
MKSKFLVVLLIFVGIAGVVWGLSEVKGTTGDAKIAAAAGSSGTSGSLRQGVKSKPILNEQGGIEVSVVWEKLPPEAKAQKFEIGLSNHVLDLDSYDFVRNVKLQLDGKSIPIQVESPNKGGAGHHVSSAILIKSAELEKVQPGTKLDLIIEKVGDTPSRIFSFVY